MKVSFYYGTNLVLDKELTSPPRANDRVVIEVNGQHSARTIAFVEWRPDEDTVIVVCPEWP